MIPSWVSASQVCFEGCYTGMRHTLIQGFSLTPLHCERAACSGGSPHEWAALLAHMPHLNSLVIEGMWSLDDKMLAAWTGQGEGQQRQQHQLHQQSGLVQQHPQGTPEQELQDFVGAQPEAQAPQGQEQELACVAVRLRYLGLLLSGCM